MRIAIDYNAALRQVAGIGRYTRELVKALSALDSGDELVLFYASRDLPTVAPGLRSLGTLQASNPHVTALPIPLPERWMPIIWQRLRLPLPVERWTGPVDIVHAPDFVLPPVRTRRTLVTVHDLSFRIHPEAAHASLRRYLEQAVPRSLRRAACVLADSASTASDLQRLMKVPQDKVRVLYPGIAPEFRRVDDPQRLANVRRKYGLPDRFVLHVGTIEPRKNLERLIDAYVAVRSAAGDVGPTALVLAGKPGWLAEPILAKARATEGVLLTGPVDDDDLPSLYSLASVLAYPSLYEGFGFPPLEALACGTPAIASNTSSLPELVGGVAELIAPYDTDALVQALRRALDRPEIAMAARVAGPKQAARFSWAAAAQQLLNIYRSLQDPRIPMPGSA